MCAARCSTVTPAAFNTPETEPDIAGFHPTPSAFIVFVRLHQAGQHSATTRTSKSEHTHSNVSMEQGKGQKSGSVKD